MPSTFTDELGLEKQATGENSGTWGTLLNAVLDKLDDAIAARLSKSVAGASDVTLTSAEALHAFHEYTGTLTGNINVIVPASQKIYFVHNNTSGSFTLTVKTSAGTGIVVPQGGKTILYCDGTNVVSSAGYFKNVTDATARDEFPSLGQIQDAAGIAVNDTGTADTYAITLSPAITAYAAYQRFYWKAGNTNTGASTLNVNSLGAKSILWPDGTVLSAGDIPANAIVETSYDGVQFLLLTVARKLGTAAYVDTGAAASEVPTNDQAFTDVASATTTDIGAATSLNVRITGTTTITGLGTVAAGIRRKVRFAASLTLTYNATSLILPGAENITTAANDTAEFISLGSGNWLCLWYMPANANLVGGGGLTLLDRNAAQNTIVNTASETSMYSYSVPGGTLGTDKAIRVYLAGEYLNNSGAGRTLRIRIKYGATTIFDVTTSSLVNNVNSRGWYMDFTLSAGNSTSVQLLTGLGCISSAVNPASGYGSVIDSNSNASGFGGSAAEDSTAAKTLDITFQHAVADANLSIRADQRYIELLP